MSRFRNEPWAWALAVAASLLALAYAIVQYGGGQ